MLQHFFQSGVEIVLPLVFQVGGNTKVIATHLQEVHYRLAVTSMSTQSILDHCSACKAKCAKECAEQEAHEKAKKLHKKKSKSWEQEKTS